MSLAFKKDCVNFSMVYEVGNKKSECSNIKGFILCVMSSKNSVRWLSVNKYTKNLVWESGGKFTGLHSLSKFFGVGGNLSMCKLQFEFVATAALFAVYMWSEQNSCPFPLIMEWSYACRQQAQHIHCCSTFTSLFTCRVFVCLQPELFLRGLKGNLVAPFNCFLPEASTDLRGSAPWGVATGFCIRWCLYFNKSLRCFPNCQVLHSVFALFLKADVLHGNWPKSDLSSCLWIQPQGN